MATKTASKQPAVEATCGERKFPDGVCDRPAGWATDHPGEGRCRIHGGALPSNARLASWRASLALLIDEPVDIEPSQALLWCIALTAQEVAFANYQISEISEPTHLTIAGEQLDIWIVYRDSATERLARYSKMALDAGVAERQVQLAERMADLIVPVLEGILSDLGLTAKQKRIAPDIVRGHLTRIEGGAGGLLGAGPVAPPTRADVA